MLSTSCRLLRWGFSMVVTFLFPIPTTSLAQRMNGPWFLEAQATWAALVPNFSNSLVTKSSLHVALTRMRCVSFHLALVCVPN